VAASDDDLVAAYLATGSGPYFDELVRRHHAAIRSLLRRFCRVPALADDLAQDTFIKALAHLGSYNGGNRFRSWLGGIAYREFLMASRSSRRLQKLHTDAAVFEAACDTGRGASPEDRLDLDRALDQLPEAERTAVVLSYACGMSHSEIASTMDLPLGTIKTYIERSRKTLHEALSQDPRT
jgi:RNA polymerase sigma-70 factor, ECF subfamily